MKKIVLTVLMFSCLLISPSVYSRVITNCDCYNEPKCPPSYPRCNLQCPPGQICYPCPPGQMCWVGSITCVKNGATCWDVICSRCEPTSPTLVTLIDFNAVPGNRIVTLVWSTASEIDNAGFNLYRSLSENGEYEKINESLIQALGSSTEGASYEFIDTNVQNRKTYYYKLEDIDLSGKSTVHGPVSTMPKLILGILGK